MFDDARRLRAAMGNAAFFNQLGGNKQGDDGWGRLGSGWDAASFEAAMSAPPMATERSRLVGDLVDAYFESARSMASTEGEGFVSLDEGLSIMSKHAQALGYDAVVLFLDELILWLASHAADHTFLSREGQKVGKLVESMIAERPIPLVSFIARQRDLRELVGDCLPGAEQLGFADVLNWWEARFDEVTLEDRNLPAIVEKRLLRPKSAAAAQDLQNAFEQTARVREEVMNTLLTRAGDRDMFRQVYPFSPALVQTLVAISSLLQRERTALKLMLQLLVNQRDVLQLGDIVPVGDLFDVIVEGDEPFTQAMRLNFDHAKRLYRQKLLPMLEQEHSVTAEDVNAGAVDAARAQRFRTDDRLLKTLILSALAPEVEALRALTPSRLAALNHGTIRSPIPGQESQIVLSKCRNWAAQVGEIKIADEGANPAISLHIVGVDTEGILANAQSFDSYGNRIQKARSLLYEQIGLEAEDRGLLPPRYDLLWRGTWRTCEILFRNVRELSLDSLKAPEDMWRMVIDFPFDREGHPPADDQHLLAGDADREVWSKRARQQMHEAWKEFTWLAPDGTVVVRGKNDAAEGWTFAGTGANATLAFELSQMTKSRVTHDSFTVTFESHVSFEALEQALRELRLIDVSEMCVAVDEQALAGLKFSECLPHDLALDMLRTRLSDLPAGQWVLEQPVRFVQA